MKIKYIAVILLGAMALGSCSDFTEIDQKGMNLLDTTDQLEMLLNQEYYYEISNLNRLCGSVIYYPGNVGTVLNNPVKTTTQIILKYDEEGHAREMVDLTASDGNYASCYEYIGTVANPILSKIGTASGSDAKKQAIKAEAYTIRAYFHWLAAIKFARAYNPATAETEKCIAYLLETQDIKQPTVQLTQKEVYTNILSDLDAAIELDALPETAANRMRFSKAAPYAIKAMVLMYMQQPSEAAKAAKQALDIDNTITDLNTFMMTTTSMMGFDVPTLEVPKLAMDQDYFTDSQIEFFSWLTPHYYEMFEDKHLVKDWFETYHTALWMGDFASTSMIVSQDLMGMFGVSEGSMSYGVMNEGRIGTINVSTPHMYLILAEDAINNGKIDDAMGYLDNIRVGRFFHDDYAPLKGVVTTKEEAIKMLKKVQHGENVFGVHNFINLKRWNELPDYKEDYSWTYDDVTYTLKAGSDMWVFPFPKNLMNKNTNFQHNYTTVAI